MIQSTKDEYVPEGSTGSSKRRAKPPKKLVLIDARNHRFGGKHTELRRDFLVGAGLDSQHPSQRESDCQGRSRRVTFTATPTTYSTWMRSPGSRLWPTPLPGPTRATCIWPSGSSTSVKKMSHDTWPWMLTG